MRRYAALGLAAALAGCSAASIGGLAPRAASPSAKHALLTGGRGTIDSLVKVTVITKAQMEGGIAGPVVTEIGGKPLCDATLYAIVYQTIGVHGEPANASEALMVPDAGCKGPFPLVGYAHGTNLSRAQLITDPKTTNPNFTAPDQDPIVVAAIFAGHGYVVSATDYLGLGKSTYPYHPYLQVESEASAVIDAMRAARTAAKQLGVALDGKVVLAGHSQGGQVAVGTQRAIERDEPGEFRLEGTIASSGPYALTQTFIDSLHHQSEDAPVLAAYILTGYQKTYKNIYDDPTQVFKDPYAGYIDTLLPTQTYAQENDVLDGKLLPLSTKDLLTPQWRQSFLTDPRSGARVDTHLNDLLYGWKPKAEIYLCGGSRDPEVEYKNALLAQKYFNGLGAPYQLFNVNSFIPASVPLVDYHVTVAVICLPLIREAYFDPMFSSAK
ncbi:MAG TPA: alpha/beta fold hydrolase [Verrucomicrobiae bacterium]|nr:alpha/beta fold hydrolase [Verrucomicrobiae bacterium]